MNLELFSQYPIKSLILRAFLFPVLVFGVICSTTLAHAATSGESEDTTMVFQRVPMQYIAALGDPDATSGKGAETWGLWRRDPGPRGVWLANFHHLQAAGGFGPGNWRFDDRDWWLDENGLIMEQPDFPVPAGKYIVTGGREAVSMLTIHPVDENGEQNWELNRDATLYDVTHLGCRSARYTPVSEGQTCSPETANQSDFPVEPGGIMPAVDSCAKQDYTVLLVIAIGIEV
ncbi:MAG: hypothetical protein KTR18_17095 [Acidiferrobacterales bacterium]|nr:hypothetical protein [Acidiferrobacterales bacterium]